MKLFFLLGNQLFSEKYLENFRKDHTFFMAEDYQLCTYEKHHKQKILLFLSAMRSHADKLKKNKFKIEYSSIEDKSFKSDYIEKLLLRMISFFDYHINIHSSLGLDLDHPRVFLHIYVLDYPIKPL